MTFLQGLPAPVFYFGLGMVCLLAGAMFAAAYVARRNARALAEADPLDPSDLSPGYHLVWGNAAGPDLAAPLTGRACAWYDLTVWESRRSVTDGKSEYCWHELRSESSNRLLTLSDGRTDCAVDTEGAQVYPSDWSEWRGQTETPTDRDPPLHPGTVSPGGGLQVDVQGHGAANFRYRERYIRLNDPLFALGNITRHEPALPDDDGDTGDDDDWAVEQQREADSAGALWQISKLAGRPFILSTRPPDQIGTESALAARAGLAMGGVFAVLALWMLWQRLG